MLTEKMLQFKLPAAHSVSVPAGEALGLHRTALLGRSTIFGHEENDGFQDSPRAVCPFVEGGDGREQPPGQLHTSLDREVIEEIRDFLEWGSGRLFGDHEFRGCGFGCRGFDTRGCFLLCLPSGRFSGCCRFWLGLLRPSRLPGGCHFRLRGRLRDRLRSGFRM